MRVLGLVMRIEGQVRVRARALLGLGKVRRVGEGPKFRE